MSEAPKRIRVWPDYNDHTTPVSADWTGGYWDNTDDPKGTEYIRADLVEAAITRALEEAMRIDAEYWKGSSRVSSLIAELDPAQFIEEPKG
jgi:hypothetical protein